VKHYKKHRCLIYDNCLECGKRTRSRVWMLYFCFCSLKCFVIGTGEASYDARW
jgi:endogenous inhibitor of DNA gyrase (YacG/DUF329 family)